MIKLYAYGEVSNQELFARENPTAGVADVVADILNTVRQQGDRALYAYAEQFDGAKLTALEVTEAEIQEAFDTVEPEFLDILREAAANIRAFHEKQVRNSFVINEQNGVLIGQKVTPIEKVGLYVPGGTAAYPSSVLMTAIPAKVAGVEELIIVTPPTENLSVEVLTAARIAGVDTIIAVGGTQAIAALTYGAGFIPQVDKIVGPGNAYVAAAKKMAFGTVDIDMIAGPSEVLVIADHTANPSYIAADLLSQAEHDRLASAVLLTDSMAQAQAISAEMERQAKGLPRWEIIRDSVRNYGCAIVFEDLKDACRMANTVAPEHLEVVTANPRELLPYLTNAGAIFLGAYSPEPLGDYMAGPSHVLPTSGTARFFSPLSTDTFLKKTSVIEYSREQLETLSTGIINLAQAEKLDAHANSVRIRFPEES